MENFSSGVGNRAASFRIPTSTAQANGAGYVEDRRPASNIDAYIVAALLIDTSLNDETQADPLVAQYQKYLADETE